MKVLIIKIVKLNLTSTCIDFVVFVTNYQIMSINRIFCVTYCIGFYFITTMPDKLVRMLIKMLIILK